MNTDYTEFVNRYRRKTKPFTPKKSNQIHLALLVGVVCLYVISMIYIVSQMHMSQSTVILAICVFLMASALAYATRRTQALLKRQEKGLILLNEVFESSRGGRMITDGSDNTLHCNTKFKEICTPQQPGTYAGLVDMFSSNDKAATLFEALSEKAHNGVADSIELYCQKQDYEGWYQVSAQPVPGHAGFIHWRIDNVTERYTADRAVRDEREKLIDFTDNAPVGFFSVDESGQFVFANATLARWLGVDLQELLDKEYVHTYLLNPPKKGKPYDLIDKGGDKQLVEVEMKGAGGKTFLASINQSIMVDKNAKVRTRAVVHDLTSEHEMRRALKASEDRFLRFYEEAPLGIILVNNDGLIEDCNSQFAHMIGQTRSAIEKTHFKLLIADEDRERVLETMKKMQKGQSMKEALEVSLQGQDSSKVSTQLHARHLTDNGVTVLHFIDVTDKKALEQQFVQSQKMQAVGQLAGGIAHDFNNLLTAIIGFCDLLLLRHRPGDPSFGDIMQIKQNSNRASNLVRQLLAFSRQQTLRPRVHDITDILTELSHLLRRLIGATIELDMTHGSDLGLVKVDEGQMEQVLINLAVNARDAMKGQGYLSITTENFTNKEELSVIEEKMPPGHWVLIKVTDTGCGISKDNISRILEPFFTTKAVGEGTGLGLATVYGIIRQTGGFLDIESEIGKGTTFFIYLPRISETEEEEDMPAAEEKNASKDLTGSECILLVEDETAVRTFAQRALVNKGYEVLSAENGEIALEMLQEEGLDKIDLLVTDVVMPGIDGPTLAQRVRQSSPNLKIIFMSGYTEDKLKEYMGDNTYFLPKPFTLKGLAAKVKDVLGV
ncbi:MAG: PAS domain S-box protein [Alphaproteobacteria bacterium]